MGDLGLYLDVVGMERVGQAAMARDEAVVADGQRLGLVFLLHVDGTDLDRDQPDAALGNDETESARTKCD